MFLKKIATSSQVTMRAVQAAKMPLMSAAPATRAFGHTKYAFDDEDWKPNQFQLSADTHMSNAEELINDLPIVMVHGSVTRCTGVQGMGLGHPVQYI